MNIKKKLCDVFSSLWERIRGFFSHIWECIRNFFTGLSAEKWLLFVGGLLLAAFFNISLGVGFCLFPDVFFGGFIALIEMRTSDTGDADWRNFVAVIAGGAFIQLFQILGNLWIG